MRKISDAVEFSGPPPAVHTGSNSRHARIAAQLTNHPGRWAYIHYGSSGSARSTALAIRTGKLSAYAPAGTYEAVARTVIVSGQEDHRVYLRYVGSGSSPKGDAA